MHLFALSFSKDIHRKIVCIIYSKLFQCNQETRMDANFWHNKHATCAIYIVKDITILKLKTWRKCITISSLNILVGIIQFNWYRIDRQNSRHRKVLREKRVSVGTRRKFQSAGCECQHFSRRECERDVFDQGTVTFLWNAHVEHLRNFILTGCERGISFGYPPRRPGKQ